MMNPQAAFFYIWKDTFEGAHYKDDFDLETSILNWILYQIFMRFTNPKMTIENSAIVFLGPLATHRPGLEEMVHMVMFMILEFLAQSLQHKLHPCFLSGGSCPQNDPWWSRLLPTQFILWFLLNFRHNHNITQTQQHDIKTYENLARQHLWKQQIWVPGTARCIQMQKTKNIKYEMYMK